MGRRTLCALVTIAISTAISGLAQMTSSYNSYDNVTVSMDASGNISSATVTSTLEGDTLWNGYPPCHHTGTAVVDFGGIYSSASVGPVWPNYYMDRSAYVTLPATADCFTGGTGGGCYISQDFVLVNCDCEGTFFQAEGSQSGGSSTNWSLEIQGPEYIFVGTDPKVVPGNFYVLTSKSGGLPQPSGGQFSVSSSEPTDSFAYGTYNGAPKVTVMHPARTGHDHKV